MWSGKGISYPIEEDKLYDKGLLSEILQGLEKKGMALLKKSYKKNMYYFGHNYGQPIINDWG